MRAKIIDGKRIASERQGKLSQDIAKAVRSLGRPPHIGVIMASPSAASHVYVGAKERKAKELGFNFTLSDLGDKATHADIEAEIISFNANPIIDGFIVQLPLPKGVDVSRISSLIDPAKDIDAFHPTNVGKLWRGESAYFYPCTPQGIVHLIHSTGVPLDGLRAVIIGRSNIVGKPLGAMLLSQNATVTFCHSHTKDLPSLTKSADVLVAALGIPEFVKGNMIKPGSIVIDVGISRVNNKLTGDVHFESASEVAGHITPVPGGVGPMTIICLMENVVKAALAKVK